MHAGRLLANVGACAVCRSGCTAMLCTACVARYAAARPRCQRCGLATPQPQQHCGHCLPNAAVDATVAATDYGFPWDRLLARLKYHQQPGLATGLAALMQAAVQAAMATAALPRPAWVLPVPLGPARLRERGYNQAWELARRVARGLRLPASPTVLVRLHDSGAQATLDRAHRLANLRHAFMVPPAQAAQLQGAQVALVDDVLTTGATADTAARALREAGAAGVQLWVLARTPPPHAD